MGRDASCNGARRINRPVHWAETFRSCSQQTFPPLIVTMTDLATGEQFILWRCGRYSSPRARQAPWPVACTDLPRLSPELPGQPFPVSLAQPCRAPQSQDGPFRAPRLQSWPVPALQPLPLDVSQPRASIFQAPPLQRWLVPALRSQLPDAPVAPRPFLCRGFGLGLFLQPQPPDVPQRRASPFPVPRLQSWPVPALRPPPPDVARASRLAFPAPWLQSLAHSCVAASAA